VFPYRRDENCLKSILPITKQCIVVAFLYRLIGSMLWRV
jgi:hypothetical protein